MLRGGPRAGGRTAGEVSRIYGKFKVEGCEENMRESGIVPVLYRFAEELVERGFILGQMSLESPQIFLTEPAVPSSFQEAVRTWSPT